MQPKQPQPPSHLVAVLHGEVPRFLVVEVAVEVKVDLASKAFNKEKDPKSERENILSTASPTCTTVTTMTPKVFSYQTLIGNNCGLHVRLNFALSTKLI